MLWQIATSLAHWATPKFRNNVRKDTELPDNVEELMQLFDRFFLTVANIFFKRGTLRIGIGV